MEEHKLRYLQLFLQRRKETCVDKYVNSMRNLVERAQRCYAEPTPLDDNAFVKIMLLDGCFIIELFHRFADLDEDNRRSDPIFKMPWLCGTLGLDLLLLENQLPFFVLEELFNMNKNQHETSSLINLALNYFEGFCGTYHGEGFRTNSIGVRHLLCLIHSSRLPAVRTMKPKTKLELKRFIGCATELREAGIRFKKGSVGCIFNLNFKNGIMEIPPLQVVDQTESFFRNLIAYEQYDSYRDHYYFSDYVTFFDCLINSPKDVELLRQAGSISNWLGDDEVISNMFNKLGDNVVLASHSFYYSHTFAIIDEHCDKPWNKHLAKLRHNYFNSPWSLASFLAALALLLLTMMQTVYSFLSFGKQ